MKPPSMTIGCQGSSVQQDRFNHDHVQLLSLTGAAIAFTDFYEVLLDHVSDLMGDRAPQFG